MITACLRGSYYLWFVSSSLIASSLNLFFIQMNGVSTSSNLLLPAILFYITWKTRRGLYQLLMMVSGGTQACIHLHMSRLLYWSQAVLFEGWGLGEWNSFWGVAGGRGGVDLYHTLIQIKIVFDLGRWVCMICYPPSAPPPPPHSHSPDLPLPN